MAPANRHACCVLVDEAGVLVTGPSGSGKTLLALALIDRVRHDGRFAALVSDDQVLLQAAGGRLIARAPASIAGLAERWGLGVIPLEHEPAAVVRLVVDLCADDQLERMPPAGATVPLEGLDLPLLRVPRRRLDLSVPLVLAALFAVQAAR